MSDPSDNPLKKLIAEIHRRSLWQVLVILPFLGVMSCTDQTEVSPANGVSNPLTESERLNDWLDQEFERNLDFSPERRTQLGDKKDYDRFGDVSEEARDEHLEWTRQSVATMRAEFDYDLLTEEAKTSYDLYAYLLDRAELGQPFRHHLYPFRRGSASYFPNFMINLHRVDNVEDMRAYNSRLRQIGPIMRQLLEYAQTAAEDGIRAEAVPTVVEGP